MKHSIVIVFLGVISVMHVLSSFSASDEGHPHTYTLEYGTMYGAPKVPVDNPMTVEGVWLGRLLFYDPVISINGKMSCSTCHQQKLYFTDGLRTAIGVHGDTLKRNTMGIVNLAWEKYFFWDGRDTSLEEVASDHIKNPLEMGGLSEAELINRLKSNPHYAELFKQAFPNEAISMATVSKAIAQFTRTIILNFKSGPEKFKEKGNAYGEELQSESHDGTIGRVALMQCKVCHGKAAGGQVKAVYEDGTVYKAPTMVNIKYTAPYMHDGRFKTLREVFMFYDTNLGDIKTKNPHLTGSTGEGPAFTQYDFDHADETFSGNVDSSITTNAEFSNPFIQKGFSWSGILIGKEKNKKDN